MSENRRLHFNHRRTSARAPFPDFPNTCIFSFNGQCHILTDKANTLNKISVPIKEYSNKFFRESCSRLAQVPIKKVQTQKRFNVILKKKQLLTKNIPKINSHPFMDQSMELNRTGPEQILKVSRVRQATMKKRVKTQAAARGMREKVQVNENLLTQMQSQLLLSSTLLSNLLNPQTTNLRETINMRIKRDQASLTPNKNKSRSVSIPCEQKQKISQSRGLEIYSKIFVRNKSQMIQKQKEEHIPHKKTLGNTWQGTFNHFQARRIFPVTKNKKGMQIDRKLLQTASTSKTYRSNRTKPYKTLQPEEENFQLRGWETSA